MFTEKVNALTEAWTDTRRITGHDISSMAYGQWSLKKKKKPYHLPFKGCGQCYRFLKNVTLIYDTDLDRWPTEKVLPQGIHM